MERRCQPGDGLCATTTKIWAEAWRWWWLRQLRAARGGRGAIRVLLCRRGERKGNLVFRTSSTAQVPSRALLHHEPDGEKKRRRAKGGAVGGLGDGAGEGGGVGVSSLLTSAAVPRGADAAVARGPKEARMGQSGAVPC